MGVVRFKQSEIVSQKQHSRAPSSTTTLSNLHRHRFTRDVATSCLIRASSSLAIRVRVIMHPPSITWKMISASDVMLRIMDATMACSSSSLSVLDSISRAGTILSLMQALRAPGKKAQMLATVLAASRRTSLGSVLDFMILQRKGRAVDVMGENEPLLLDRWQRVITATWRALTFPFSPMATVTATAACFPSPPGMSVSMFSLASSTMARFSMIIAHCSYTASSSHTMIALTPATIGTSASPGSDMGILIVG
mmetsp:Transcript_36302/g.49117  ORF Transcript_36302/g.49117 Transcript_36302/m.49117 type:complete len:252 (-) Transcript_36302:485-1240(-)